MPWKNKYLLHLIWDKQFLNHTVYLVLLNALIFFYKYSILYNNLT